LPKRSRRFYAAVRVSLLDFRGDPFDAEIVVVHFVAERFVG
jgi:hypothetical protein